MAANAGKKPPGRAFARLRRLVLTTLAVLVLPVLAYWTLGLLVYRFVEPPATPLMVIRSIERVHLPWRDPAPLESIARSLALSVVVAEDSGFCLHRGIDLDAVEDAVGDYVNKGRVRGASTITMQVARNLFLWPGGGVVRKLVELPLALALDALWPKRRILEVYLNIAEWGPGIFGAQAAARFHFQRPAAQLDAQQAALLAAVLPNPNRWSASDPTQYIRERANRIRSEVPRLSRAQLACLAP